jgi:hypothetical protein
MASFHTIHPATGGGFDAVETGQVVDIAHAETAGVFVGGTFVGTILIEVSFDGTNWATYATHTAAGTTLIAIPVKQVRARCSAYTSGLAVAYCSVKDTNRLA